MNLDMVPEYLLVLSITERTNHGSFISSDAVVGLGFESVLSKKEREREGWGRGHTLPASLSMRRHQFWLVYGGTDLNELSSP
jgi:hypothetical protein